MTDVTEDDVMDLTPDMEVEVEDQQEVEDDDGLALEIEGEEVAEDTPLIRQMRQQNRDLQRELHESRKAQSQPQQTPVTKPTLESCEYDDERFEKELDAWKDAQRAEETRKTRAQEQEHARSQTFERAAGKYQASAAALKIKNFEQAQQAVVDTLSADFLGAIIQYADDPAKLVGALGNNPAALAKVAAETDPMVQFKMLLKMEGKIVAKRNAPPPPETDTIQRGTAAVPRQKGDAQMDKLMADAMKKYDFTKVAALKAQRKEAANG